MNGVTIESARILLPVVITLIAPLFIWLFKEDENKREAVSFIAAALTFISVLSMAPAVLNGDVLVLQSDNHPSRNNHRPSRRMVCPWSSVLSRRFSGSS